MRTPTLAKRARLAQERAEPQRPRSHPFAVKLPQLTTRLEALWRLSRPSVKPRMTLNRHRLVVSLPSLASRPWPSPEMIAAGWALDPVAAQSVEAPHNGAPLALWRVDALALDLETAVTLFAGLPSREREAVLPLEVEPGDNGARQVELLGSDLRFWAVLARFVLSLLARQRYIPSVDIPPPPDLAHDSTGYWLGPSVVATWRAVLAEPEDRAYFERLVSTMPPLCLAAVESASGPYQEAPRRGHIPPGREALEAILQACVQACIREWVRRDGLQIALPARPRAHGSAFSFDPRHIVSFGNVGYNPMPGSSVTARWIVSLREPGRAFYVAPTEMKPFIEGMHAWQRQLPGVSEGGLRLCFRLVAPGGDPIEDEHVPDDEALPELPRAAGAPGEAAPSAMEERSEHHAVVPPALVIETVQREGMGDPAATPAGDLETGEQWQLKYLLQARDDPSLVLPMAQVWGERAEVARFLDRHFHAPREMVIAEIARAAGIFPPLMSSLRTQDPFGCALSGAEAYQFLVTAAPLLAEADFGVLLPPWWKRARAKPTLKLALGGGKRDGSGLLGLESVLAYDWRLALGGAELSAGDLKRLAELKQPLVRLRGQWVELRREDVEPMLTFMRTHASGRMSLGEALRASLTGELDGAGLALAEVRADEWIGTLLGQLRGGEAVREVAQPDGLRGTLRPYQARGLGWLDFLTSYGLGACLADDMGLGKTIELLALLLRAKAAGRLTKPVLLVCPTSVVGNWRHESARFAPDLRVLVHHGAERAGRADVERFQREAAGYDLLVTTYSLLPRDEEALGSIEWGGVVLDEAQNIKNPETRQSRVARGLRAPVRVTLTGTPVENRLAELWSLMDFLNPGYLGASNRFQERFAGPIERLRDERATRQLQALVQPFILRRVKTDPDVIKDLPEKLEMREYCSLTREQVTLYEAVVRDGLRRLEEAESPMRRRGVVLSLLVRLKQVCNHPAHLLADNSALSGRSGKLIRLEELIEELLAEGDRALIFTQFTALGERLAPYLAERFGVEVLYLHGGVARTRRERMVARYQSPEGPPLFLLSLRAGGIGLNLTNANHVIHFDRWWNPAVENQATDRAFRIGQTRNVQVRKLICSGTLEERIDQLIEQKRDLADQVIGSGEGWLTEFSTEQLRDLFTLRADALAE
jgi:SNF2 family DNA or RNA helicase